MMGGHTLLPAYVCANIRTYALIGPTLGLESWFLMYLYFDSDIRFDVDMLAPRVFHTQFLYADNGQEAACTGLFAFHFTTLHFSCTRSSCDRALLTVYFGSRVQYCA